MVCNKCGKQMQQYLGIGGGSMSDKYYTTWEIKHCAFCDEFVLEEYNAIKIDQKELEKYCLTLKKLDKLEAKVEKLEQQVS